MAFKRVTRRQFLGIVGLSSAAAAAWKAGLLSHLAGLEKVTSSRYLIGTVVSLTVLGEERAAAQAAVQATLNQMAALEGILSRFLPDSQVSRLNRTGTMAQASTPLLELLQLSRQISEQSNGAFDVTVKPLLDLYQSQPEGTIPGEDSIREARSLVGYHDLDVDGKRVTLTRRGMAITLDGIAKGYIVDAGVGVLRGHGFENVLAEAGGDLLAVGENASGTPWQIGIRAPRHAESGLVGRFRVENQGAATSGDYMQPFTADYRYHHIIDPRTGYSSPELACATVTAPSSALADVLATTIMVLGTKDGLELLKLWPLAEAFLVTKNSQIVRTPGFGGL